MQDGLGDLCDGGCEMGWGCVMVAIIDIIALAATMDLHSNVNRLPLLSKNPQRERCSSHRRPRTAKTHKGQIRDLQQRGETHDMGLEFALRGSSPLVGFFFSLNFDGGGGDGVAMYRW